MFCKRPSERHSAGLDELEKVARHDLARLNYPPANWVPEKIGPDGRPVLDVLIVGAGMCGQTAGWGLLREGIRKISKGGLGGERDPTALERAFDSWLKQKFIPLATKAIQKKKLGVKKAEN